MTDWSGDQPQALPFPRLVGAKAVERLFTVHVRPPLQLQAFHPEGCRLLDRRADADGVETWSFDALRDDAGLAIALAARAGVPGPVDDLGRLSG